MEVTLFTNMLFILVIVTPPLLCYLIAKVDGRSSMRWFWYGLFFGIYAVLYLVFYTKDGDEDRIPVRMLILLVIMTLLMAVGIYQTFFSQHCRKYGKYSNLSNNYSICFNRSYYFCILRNKICKRTSFTSKTMDFLCILFWHLCCIVSDIKETQNEQRRNLTQLYLT